MEPWEVLEDLLAGQCEKCAHLFTPQNGPVQSCPVRSALGVILEQGDQEGTIEHLCEYHKKEGIAECYMFIDKEERGK